MSTPDSRTNTRLYLYVAVAVLVALSIALLWLNDQQVQELQNAQNSLYNAQVEIRVLQAETIFGTPFIAPFRALDQHGQPATLPGLGDGHQLLLIFKSGHSPGDLGMMSSFGSVIGDNVPVIGVLQGEAAEEITPIVEKYKLAFPVYLAVDSPFELPRLPHCVLIDGAGNVLHLSPIAFSETKVVEGQILELAQMVRGLESAVQPDLTVRLVPTARPDQERGQPDQADLSDQEADQMADESAGIYRPNTVDTSPEIVYFPELPSEDIDLNFNGDGIVQLVVGTNGNVVAVVVERSTGRAEVDSLILNEARKLIFTPAAHDGARVKFRTVIPFMFRQRPPSPGEETVVEE